MSTPDQIAQVLAKLREWDDDDNAALREQRLQALDALLAGTNAMEIVQALPTQWLGYAFATPAFRQSLLADPSATLDWLRAHTNILSTQGFTFVKDWRQTDDGGLRRYLDALPAGEDKQSLIAVAGQEALSRSPVETILWACDLNNGPTQNRLLQMATAAWAGQDPQAAVDWLRQIPDPDLQAQLAGSFAAGYARSNPAQAAGWLVQSLPPGPALDQATAEVAWTWALTQPEAVGAWVGTLPAGQPRQQMLNDLVNVWSYHDAGSLEAWIATLPDHQLQAEATASYSQLGD